MTVGLNCTYFDARGLMSKAVKFRPWISRCDRDVVAITETWLREGRSKVQVLQESKRWV